MPTTITHCFYVKYDLGDCLDKSGCGKQGLHVHYDMNQSAAKNADNKLIFISLGKM